MSKRDKAQKRHQKELKRQQKNKAASARNSESFQPSLRLEELIDKANYLIRERHYEEAEQILQGEDRRKRNRPEILDSLIYLYQTTQDHVNMARTAERLVRVQPRNPEAWIMMAQGYLLSMRVPMALNAYRHFLERWPEHKHASRAQAAIEIAETAVQQTLKEFDMADSEFELLVLHDEILFEISCGEFDDAVAKARELLNVKPELVSARNNLVLALFQIGEIDEAVRVCEETCQLFPFNQFAEANLGRLLFLTGSVNEAAQIADCIIQNPATQQDAVAMQSEFLSLLGRDADVLKLVEHAETIPGKDPRCIAALHHCKAVALMRWSERETDLRNGCTTDDVDREITDDRAAVLDRDLHPTPGWNIIEVVLRFQHLTRIVECEWHRPALVSSGVRRVAILSENRRVGDLHHAQRESLALQGE